MSYNPDYYHIGNGVACWYYKHDTSMRGINCDYSHAPDIRSVRDKGEMSAFIAYKDAIHLPPVPALAKPVKPPKSSTRKQVWGNSMVVKGRAAMDPGAGILIL
ncbi:hypothetical protein ARMGADRAFT_1038260 [Armillaria gallica]|uniref:C3H1-type domain-containing protein n=1 Tax=Armillaria gallica TaxID=47427 RepID=A0A2H3CM72_ARMGA|nr:hypothetical protein ARMGADRAFT_1038260 [Armillaria gallica]